MSDTFTPGPWKADCGANTSRIWGPTETEALAFPVAECHSQHTGDYRHNANARLIAASPELLAACRAMIADWEADRESSDTTMALVGAAVAKATKGAA